MQDMVDRRQPSMPVEQAKEHSGTLLAKLGGLENREAAQKLKGSKVFVRREALPRAAGRSLLPRRPGRAWKW